MRGALQSVIAALAAVAVLSAEAGAAGQPAVGQDQPLFDERTLQPLPQVPARPR